MKTLNRGRRSSIGRCSATAAAALPTYSSTHETKTTAESSGLGVYALSEAVNDGVVALGKPGRQVHVKEACAGSGGL